MQVEPRLVLAAHAENGDLELCVNFGVFAGRDATEAELDELARRLIGEVGDVSVVAEKRHEIGARTEATLHQVRVVVDADRLPADETELAELRGRLVERAEAWARDRIASRHAEVTEV